MSFASVGRRGRVHAHPARSFPHAVAPRTVAALALSSLALAPLTAQAPRTGWVEVVVTGDDRAPIAAAIVTLTPTATGAAPRSSLTGTRGTVLLGPVDAWIAALRVRHLGLRDASRGVTVVAGDTVRLAVTL